MSQRGDHDDAIEEYALGVADGSYEWYRTHAIRARRFYKWSESLLIVISATVPIAGLVGPDRGTVSAVLGLVIVVLVGLRALYHWQDDYLRFSQAREAVEAQRRLFRTNSPPYDDLSTRATLLVGEVTRIEREEMGTWVRVVAGSPKAEPPTAAVPVTPPHPTPSPDG